MFMGFDRSTEPNRGSSGDREHAAIDALRAILPPYLEARIKVSGYLDPSTGEVGDDPTAGAQPGYMWVHGYPRGANVQVIAGTTINPYLPNQRVYVGQNDAGQAVAFAPVIDRNSLFQFGAVLPALNQPSGADELLPRSILGLGFVPGRVEPSQLGGLYLHIRSFWYEGGTNALTFYDGDEVNEATGKPTANDFDIAGDVTAGADESQWVLVGFDPVAGAPFVVVTTPMYGEPTSLDPATIDTSGIPYGTYALGAVAVSGSTTTLSGSSFFVDLRLHLATNGTTQADFNRIVVDADGAVVTDADGYVVVDFGA